MAGGNKGRTEVLVRIDKPTLKALEKVAKTNGRSRNSEIVVVLSRYVGEQKAAAEQPQPKA